MAKQWKPPIRKHQMTIKDLIYLAEKSGYHVDVTAVPFSITLTGNKKRNKKRGEKNE